MDLFGSKVKHKFLDEAQGMVQNSIGLVRTNSSASLDELYSLLITLNGSAMCADFEELAAIGLSLEEWIQNLQESSGAFSANDINLLSEFFETYEGHLTQLSQDPEKKLDYSALEKLTEKICANGASRLKTAYSNPTKFEALTEHALAPKILVVDDDETVGDIVSQVLSSKGYETEIFINPLDIPDEQLAFETCPYDLILSDLKMPELNGIELAEKIKRLNPNIPIIVMSGFGDKKEVMDLMNQDVECFIDKPFKHEDLLQAVEKYLNIYQIRQKLAEMGEKSFELSVEISKIHHRLEGIIAGLGIENEFRNILECSSELREITHELIRRNQKRETNQ